MDLYGERNLNFYGNIRSLLNRQEGQIDPVQNRECFKRAIEGSEEAVQEFISSNTRLVATVVNRFMQRYRSSTYLADDMFSEGLFVLTRAVRTLVKYLPRDEERFQHGLDSFTSPVNTINFNVIMYIYVSVYRAVQQLYERDSSDPISEKFRTSHTPRGQDTPTRKVNLDTFDFEVISCDPFQEIYLLKDIMDVCQSADERFIVDRRHKGYIDREIAEELNCDRSYVTHVKNRVYKRFCKETYQ